MSKANQKDYKSILKNTLTVGEFRRVVALSLLLTKKSFAEIECETGLSRPAMHYLFKRLEVTGLRALLDSRRGRHAHSKEGLRCRILELLVLLPRGSARSIAQELKNQDGTKISPSQVRRILKGWNLNYKKTMYRHRYHDDNLDRSRAMRELDRQLAKTLELS